MSKNVKTMINVTFVREEIFPCGKEEGIKVLVYQINGRKFYNATHIWKSLTGGLIKNSPTAYLRKRLARQMIVGLYKHMHKDALSPEQTQGLKWNTEMQSMFVFAHELEDRSFEYFFTYDLFLDYCLTMSAKLKLAVFDCAGQFGGLISLNGQDLVTALEEEMAAEEEKLAKKKYQ